MANLHTQYRTQLKESFLNSHPELKAFLRSKIGRPVRSWTSEPEAYRLVELAHAAQLYSHKTVAVDVLFTLRQHVIKGDRSSKSSI